jgi:hypothetical protein
MTVAGSVTGPHYPSASTVTRTGEALCKDSRGVPKEGCFDEPKRLGWDDIHLLPYRASTHKTTSLTLASMVFGRELCLPWDLLPGAHSDKGNQQPTKYVVEPVNMWRWPVTGWRLTMIASVGFQEEDQVWLNCQTWTTGKSPKLLPCWLGPCNVVTQINSVLYMIQCHPRV